MSRIVSSLYLATMLAAFSSTVMGADAVELQYSGTMTQLSRDGESPVAKQFDLYVLVRGEGVARRQFYTVSERGAGGWPWPERFGEITLDELNKRTDGRPAHVLHTFEGNRYPVELPAPLFEFAHRVAADATWTSGRLSWQVSGRKKVAGRNAWQVQGVDNFGRRRTLYVEEGSPYVVGAEQRVVMGRGDEFLLKLELAASRTITGPELESVAATADSLLALQNSLKREDGEQHPELSEEQLKVAAESLQTLAAVAETTPLKSLVVAIARDLETQNRRADGIAGLAKRYIGQPAPEYTLTSLNKETISSQNQEKRITVLHFWTYQSEPLEEPYGQIGYLDFIANRRGRFDVDVVGVAVDERVADPQQQGAVLRSVRKLRDFMNVSYPIALDSGATLKKYGDPRELGAELPVWIVIGPDRRIAHYHVGFYNVNPDEGLRELDAVLVKLIRDNRTGADPE